MIALASALAAVGAVSAVAAFRAASVGPVATRVPAVASSTRRTVGDRLGRLGRSRWGRRLRTTRATESLARSGWTLQPDRFAGIRLVTGAIGASVAFLLPFPGPILAPLLGLAGVRAPLFVTDRAARRRREAIDREVPQLLDLLAAGSSAGLSAPLALVRSAEALLGPLGVEVRGALDTIELGGRWAPELEDLAERLQVPDLRRTVGLLTRTGTLGSSLTDQTSALAANVRAARRAKITERARTAPVKMLFPLVFLVLPAFLLLTVVPVLLTTLQSIR